MRCWKLIICFFGFIFSINALSQTSISVVDQLLSQRQKFAHDDKIDLQQLSRDIEGTAKEANELDRAGKGGDALRRLSELTKYAPLDEFPDYDVQAVCSNIYGHFNRPLSDDCRARAHAMADILKNRIGSGSSPDDPVRVITIAEVHEWMNLHSANISNIQAYQYRDVPLQKVTYSGQSTGGQSAIAYFEINSRAFASITRSAPNVFDPLPLDGKYATAYQQAHEKRIRFLADHSFNYPELIHLCRDLGKQAMQLAQQGDYNGALSKIKEVEKVRPIHDIPIFSIISNYSYLLGKTGNAEAQSEIRLYLFGITQDIAHSGDGLSPETAIHVADDGEEYTWLMSRKLRLTKQALIMKGNSRYDALDTTDLNGNSRTYYFDVTQIFDRQIEIVHGNVLGEQGQAK
ncbi:DUF4919 domain-containing protein [Burkholderia stabilis]|uniref:DUF4919 domain-containing protein n=1 Tax=Burkholderia stabilis TaxID=95485 RepID=A0A4V1PT61_9BURK|nr:DUF4919 domain-containing protein [Burkholderia stabilis]RXV73474.1 DUF4919 domain-containing protein [Burkholderia stabilis]